MKHIYFKFGIVGILLTIMACATLAPETTLRYDHNVYVIDKALAHSVGFPVQKEGWFNYWNGSDTNPMTSSDGSIHPVKEKWADMTKDISPTSNGTDMNYQSTVKAAQKAMPEIQNNTASVALRGQKWLLIMSQNAKLYGPDKYVFFEVIQHE